MCEDNAMDASVCEDDAISASVFVCGPERHDKGRGFGESREQEEMLRVCLSVHAHALVVQADAVVLNDVKKVSGNVRPPRRALPTHTYTH